jgi:hypothetical protein
MKLRKLSFLQIYQMLHLKIQHVFMKFILSNIIYTCMNIVSRKLTLLHFAFNILIGGIWILHWVSIIQKSSGEGKYSKGGKLGINV